MTLKEFFDDFYRPLRLRGRSHRTGLLYYNTITQYQRWLGRIATVEGDLTDLQISRYLEHRTRTRSPLTAEKERSQLLACWRLACDRGMLQMRPAIPPAIIPARVPTCWTPDEIRKLVVACKAVPGKVGDVPAWIYWTSLVLVLYQCAERVGAILSVRREDYSRPRILVLAEYRKGGRTDKLHEFSEPLCDLLDVLKASKNGDKLFAWPQNYTYLWMRFGQIVAAAGIPGGRKFKFHSLRKAAATHFKAAGGDPVALLDHASPKTTKAYLDPRQIPSGPAPHQVLPQVF
jgi:integrase